MTDDELVTELERIDWEMAKSLINFAVHELHEKSPDVNRGLVIGSLVCAWADNVAEVFCPACRRSLLEAGMNAIRRRLEDQPPDQAHLH